MASDARLYPVGRLDADATGLLLVTNDGELAERLTHPRHEVPKTYEATIANPPVREPALRALGGVELDDGPTTPARARRLGEEVIELTIHEGRNRQVKRMCAAVGHPVVALRRTRFGPLRLGTSSSATTGADTAEVERLRQAARRNCGHQGWVRGDGQGSSRVSGAIAPSLRLEPPETASANP